MTTTLGFKDMIDTPEWCPCAGLPTSVQASDIGIAFDGRNGIDRDPYFYYKTSNPAVINRYHTFNDEWHLLPAVTIGGGGAGSGVWSIFVATHGPTGTVGGSPTTTSFTLAALPNSASASPNLFADNGSGVGYKIRVIGKGAGSSGKIEERFIVANTSGTTPVVYLDSALSFTPTTNDTYEILSGRVYFLQAGTTAAGYWKAWDVATRTMSGNLNVTNLASTIGTSTAGVVLDEQYVPYDRDNGEGFISGAGTYDAAYPKSCLTATAAAAGTLTGQASGGDAAVVANQYRNFQIRIVEDTTNVTAVGQRRKITSHTAGASPVYTVATNWTVTPSATCKFVIEGNNDIILWTNNATVTYSYAGGGYAADANWSTAAAAGGATQYANPSGASSSGGQMAVWAYGIEPDTALASHNGMIHRFRGSGADTLDVLDITAAATGAWSADVSYDGVSSGFSTGTCLAYDGATNDGCYAYIFNYNSTTVVGRWLRYCVKTRTLQPWAYFPILPASAAGGNRAAIGLFIDGSTKLSELFVINAGAQDTWRCLLQR